jgi:hypothetical protein
MKKAESRNPDSAFPIPAFSSRFKLIPKSTAKIAEIKQSKNKQVVFVFFAFFVVEYKDQFEL